MGLRASSNRRKVGKSMPRPPRPRSISFLPQVRYFRPLGVPVDKLDEEDLNLEEIEAIRLSDLEELSQAECARRMGISQSTFNRLLENARFKLARCLIEGRAINIRGGTYEVSGTRHRCMACGAQWDEERTASTRHISPQSCPQCGKGPIAIVIEPHTKSAGGGGYRHGNRSGR